MQVLDVSAADVAAEYEGFLSPRELNRLVRHRAVYEAYLNGRRHAVYTDALDCERSIPATKKSLGRAISYLLRS